MKDEIKEILQELKEKNETYKECSENGIIENEYYKSHILLDYITNLQEENERLKEELQQEKKDFKEANDYEFPNLYDPNISYSKAYTEQLLAEKDKEIERLNNIIDEKDYKIKKLVYSCYESDMSYTAFKEIWINAFGKSYDPKDIDKLENELKGDNK